MHNTGTPSLCIDLLAHRKTIKIESYQFIVKNSLNSSINSSLSSKDGLDVFIILDKEINHLKNKPINYVKISREGVFLKENTKKSIKVIGSEKILSHSYGFDLADDLSVNIGSYSDQGIYSLDIQFKQYCIHIKTENKAYLPSVNIRENAFSHNFMTAAQLNFDKGIFQFYSELYFVEQFPDVNQSYKVKSNDVFTLEKDVSIDCFYGKTFLTCNDGVMHFIYKPNKDFVGRDYLTLEYFNQENRIVRETYTAYTILNQFGHRYIKLFKTNITHDNSKNIQFDQYNNVATEIDKDFLLLCKDPWVLQNQHKFDFNTAMK